MAETKYAPSRFLRSAEWVEGKADKMDAVAKTDDQRATIRKLREIGAMLRQAVAKETKPDLFGADVVEAKGQIEEIVDLWNKTVTAPIPKCQRIMPALRKKIATRLKTFPATETFAVAFQYVNSSPWYRGEDSKSNGWTASLSWIVGSDDGFQRLVDKGLASRTAKQAERVAGCRHKPGCQSKVACTARMLREE